MTNLTEVSPWFLAAADSEARTPITAGRRSPLQSAPSPRPAVSELIRLARKSEPYSTAELARLIGVTPDVLATFEAGKVSALPDSAVSAMIKVLRLPAPGVYHLLRPSVDTPSRITEAVAGYAAVRKPAMRYRAMRRLRAALHAV